MQEVLSVYIDIYLKGDSLQHVNEQKAPKLLKSTGRIVLITIVLQNVVQTICQ